MTTVLVLLVCFSSVEVRADGPNDENSVAGMVKVMARQNEQLANQQGTIAALTAALEAKQMDRSTSSSLRAARWSSWCAQQTSRR